EGMTMVIATHEMGFARQVANELCYLHDGRILEWGSAEKVLEKPEKKETREFLYRVHQAGRL
ncbi:MAG: peptide ABC transporter ATP-binding protein, partial [Actinobacteria bacterium]|nr:peptide ABC transporter ATP-binding protein [Actinomycetota bacterium]